MTFDPKTVGTLKTPTSNDACVLVTSLCYVICKDNEIFEYFHNFWLSICLSPLITFDALAISILCAPTKVNSHDQTMLPSRVVCGRRCIFNEFRFLTSAQRSKVTCRSKSYSTNGQGQGSSGSGMVEIRQSLLELDSVKVFPEEEEEACLS